MSTNIVTNDFNRINQKKYYLKSDKYTKYINSFNIKKIDEGKNTRYAIKQCKEQFTK